MSSKFIGIYARSQVSIYRTIGPLVFMTGSFGQLEIIICKSYVPYITGHSRLVSPTACTVWSDTATMCGHSQRYCGKRFIKKIYMGAWCASGRAWDLELKSLGFIPC